MYFILLTLLFLRETTSDDVVSAEKKNSMQDEKTDKSTASADPSMRRFIEDLNDEEWHVSHLKETDFSKDSECNEESMLSRYRKALRNDGALVKYVSADALKPDDSELLQSNKCVPKAHGLKAEIKAKKPKSNVANADVNNKKETNKSGITDTKAAVNTATTAEDKVKGKNSSDNLRRSDYQFSSVEYYDDVIDFEATTCPDAVQVIELEIDQLRNYDVECESMIEWRSLDN